MVRGGWWWRGGGGAGGVVVAGGLGGMVLNPGSPSRTENQAQRTIGKQRLMQKEFLTFPEQGAQSQALCDDALHSQVLNDHEAHGVLGPRPIPLCGEALWCQGLCTVTPSIPWPVL